MKLNTNTLAELSAVSAVVPGNIYPAKGGRKPGTEYWLVVAVSDSGAHLIGLRRTRSGDFAVDDCLPGQALFADEGRQLLLSSRRSIAEMLQSTGQSSVCTCNG